MAARPRRPAAPSLPSELERILHDLRGPLNAMALHLEVLKHAVGGDDRARQSLETIEGAVRRLVRMLPAAAAVVAIERGSPTGVGVRALVDGAVREYGLGAVTVRGEHWPEVRGDRDLLVLAVAHLLRNAEQATAAARAHQPPEVLVEESGPTVTLIVRDWGVGLPRHPRSMVRLGEDIASGRPGVGLLVVERIARLHGGSLAFAQPPTARTDVRLTLPR